MWSARGMIKWRAVRVEAVRSGALWWKEVRVQLECHLIMEVEGVVEAVERRAVMRA